MYSQWTLFISLLVCLSHSTFFSLFIGCRSVALNLHRKFVQINMNCLDINSDVDWMTICVPFSINCFTITHSLFVRVRSFGATFSSRIPLKTVDWRKKGSSLWSDILLYWLLFIVLNKLKVKQKKSNEKCRLQRRSTFISIGQIFSVRANECVCPAKATRTQKQRTISLWPKQNIKFKVNKAKRAKQNRKNFAEQMENLIYRLPGANRRDVWCCFFYLLLLFIPFVCVLFVTNERKKNKFIYFHAWIR